MEQYTEANNAGRTGRKGRNRSVGTAEVMKYVIAVLILGYVAVILLFTGGSSKPFDEVAGRVEASLDSGSLSKQSGQALKRYYGLNSADYKGAMLYSSDASISVEEVLLIEAKNEAQTAEIREAVERRIEQRRNDFDGYAPEQVQLLENAQVLVRGRFVFMAVSPDAEQYRTAFVNSL